MSRGTGLSRSRQPAPGDASSAPPRARDRAPRTTGRGGMGQRASNASRPTAAVRRLVLERDGYACVCCGLSILGRRYSLGHRLRASQGGKAVPSNLITLLGWGGEEHHGRIDLYLDPADEAKGYRVRSGQDPAAIPVMLFSEHGSGITAWLWDDGQYHFDGPQERAA